jgi:hypothetical protein
MNIRDHASAVGCPQDQYICRLLDEYMGVGIDEYVNLNSTELRSSVNSLVNRQIYTMFISLEDIFIETNE